MRNCFISSLSIFSASIIKYAYLETRRPDNFRVRSLRTSFYRLVSPVIRLPVVEIERIVLVRDEEVLRQRKERQVGCERKQSVLSAFFSLLISTYMYL